MAATLTTAAAFVIALGARERPGPLSTVTTRISTLGYGLPGSLLAIGLYVPVATFSTWLAERHGVEVLLAEQGEQQLRVFLRHDFPHLGFEQ